MNPPLWNLWRNPIVRRYATARLRLPSMIAWSVVIQALAAFLWLSFYFLGHQHQNMTVAAAAARAWQPILIIQGILWIMKGTFSVAVGIARESVEGLTEAQRLTPLSAWHKAVGYLVGLPILETVLALSLLPWTLASVVIGNLPWDTVLRVHLLLVVSAVLHHAIGLVAGLVIKQKIVAGTVSQLIVIVLHALVPALAFLGLGLGPLGHIGVETAIRNELVPLLYQRGSGSTAFVRFFDWKFSLTGYQLMAMSLLLAFLLVVVWRRWRRAEAHLLSKPLALIFFAGVLFMSLGEITPRLRDGTLFLGPAGRELRQAGMDRAMQATTALLSAGGFGSLGLFTAMLLAGSIAPSLDLFLRARRVSARHGAARLSWTGDPRSAVPWCLALSGILLAAWLFLIREVLAMPSLKELTINNQWLPLSLGASIVLPLIVWTLLVERYQLRIACMAIFLFWIVPPMVAIVSILAGIDPSGWPEWLIVGSGFSLPFIALTDSLGGWGSLATKVPHLHNPWVASLVLHAIAIGWLSINLRRARKTL